MRCVVYLIYVLGANKKKRRSAPRPSCSVIVKHLPQSEDIYLAHNTWHSYSAMSYRWVWKESPNDQMIIQIQYMSSSLFFCQGS